MEPDFSGVVAIADAIPAMGALTSLNLADNELGAEGAKHVAEAIKVNVSALRFFWCNFELDLTSGSTAVVYGYSYYNTTKGALAKFTFSGDNQYSKPVTIETTMTEADFMLAFHRTWTLASSKLSVSQA